jgi:hypothetical protein
VKLTFSGYAPQEMEIAPRPDFDVAVSAGEDRRWQEARAAETLCYRTLFAT